MLNYLKEKRDAGFFKSLSWLMQSCRYRERPVISPQASSVWSDFASFPSVLDLNAFERQNKAEGLGMVTDEGSSK